MVTDSQVGPGQESSGYKETERNLKGVCVCVCVPCLLYTSDAADEHRDV